MAKIGVLGSGQVGEVLANGFLQHGHHVMRGSREPGKMEKWKPAANGRASVGTFAECAKYGEIVVLAVRGSAAESVLDLAGIDHLAGKTVIDTTNPIADTPPTHGVLHLFTTLEDSLMERLQRKAPQARFVKAFNSVGNARMVDPKFPDGPPTMFICGDDAKAKGEVQEILRQFGWDIEDLGSVVAARAIEPLCILWCIPGFIQNRWSHAYKVLRG
jgi:8-hydroxy-5-deazaflavin:NADPH oxidoreductase